MYAEFAEVLIFISIGVVVVVGTLILGWFLRSQRPGETKNAIYECGEPTIGSAWIRYNSRFYTVALVYLLFDVEVVLMVPAALVLRSFAERGAALWPLLALLLFVLLLVLGLAYEWRFGNLDWIGEQLDKAGEDEVSGEELVEHGK